jgi:dTDP-4-dehydrorhamnose reductase
MKIVILGGKGMLGSDLADACAAQNIPTLILDRDEVDIVSETSVAQQFDAAKVDSRKDWVVNCAAYTRVDDAEKERELCHAINATGAGVVARACASRGLRLLHISTDYVFDGTLGRACTENDPVKPLNFYGETKLEGENLVRAAGGNWLIVRTQSLYGLRGRNFIKAILNQLAQGKTSLRVVADQVSSPTFTVHLADALLRVMKADARGVVNIASGGSCSWHEFAGAIVAATRPGIPIEKLTTAQLNFPALRPAYSVLDTSLYTKLTGHKPPTWQTGLADYLAREPLAAQVRALA